ncbi:MAG: YggS family pyridoxal phosphate-dependent enzyme, partial [Anaerolineae bacterium]|nr:YggS family pyridoxal phosphate-dependent enzyme [Anaerolineae bacterium]
MSIVDNLKHVQSQIAKACAKVNRNPSEVTLVAVSKQHPISDIIEAYNAGQRHFGENRIEEMREKHPQLSHLDITWHMIGHIQSRKAKEIPTYFSLVHSIDSLHLAQKLSDIVAKAEKSPVDVLIQINISGEESKSGLLAVNWENNPDLRGELWDNIRQIYVLPHIRVLGL